MKHLINQLVTSITNISQRQITVSYFNNPVLQQCFVQFTSVIIFALCVDAYSTVVHRYTTKGYNDCTFSQTNTLARTHTRNLFGATRNSFSQETSDSEHNLVSSPKNIDINAVINVYSGQHKIKQFLLVKE